MLKPNTLKTAIIAATLLPSVGLASGYKINEQSAAGMGTAHAGRAAMAEDASVVFYNPAAMTQLNGAQLSTGFTYINGDGEFEGTSTNAAQFPGANEGYDNGGDFLGEKVIPFFYYVRPVNEAVSVGLGVFTPFGTETDYNDNFVGGAFADKTALLSVEIQPSIAYQVNEQLSIGGGIDIVYMKGTLSKYVDLLPYNALVTGLDNTAFVGYENHYEVSGDDWGVGWNLGAYYQLTEKTTLGVTYRSEIEIDLEGDSSFEDPSGMLFYSSATNSVIGPIDSRDQASKVPLTTPESVRLSVTHQLTDALLLQAGATWTGWSSFKNFDVIATENISGGLGDGYADPSDLSGLGNGYVGHIQEEWKDVWAAALGATYQLNDKIALRAGYAFDESPVTDEYRTARVPSSDRQWVTAGAQYIVDANWSFDLGAAYLFMDAMSLNEVNKALDNTQKDQASLQGEYEIDVFGLALQANYRF